MIFILNIKQILNILLLSIIESISEILPISSTVHFILISPSINFTINQTLFFESFIQLGSIFSLILLFRKQCLKVIFFNVSSYSKKTSNLTLLHIFLSTFPTALIGFFFHSQIKNIININNIFYSIIGGTIFLLFAQLYLIKNNKNLFQTEITYFQAFFIGLIQCIALFPGFSRLGITISGAILMNLEKKFAIRYSFIIAIPIVIGASIFNIVKLIQYICIKEIYLCIIGLLFSFFISILITPKILIILEKYSLYPFILYRSLIVFTVYFYSKIF